MDAVTCGQTELKKSHDEFIASGSRRRGRLSSSTGRRFRIPPFLNKVYEFVNDPDTNAVISWTSGGTRFTVWDHHMFSKEILPRYFRHDVFSSFVYQLNNYGFKKTSWDYWEYENQWFQQGKEHLLVNIRRKNDINSPATNKRNKAEKRWLDSDSLIIEKLVKRQENMEKQIQSLFKQQKIVISMISAFVPKIAQQMKQNVGQDGNNIGEAEIANKAIVATESIANENALVLGDQEHGNTGQQSLISFDDSVNLVQNQKGNVNLRTNAPSSNTENFCSWSLMAVDDNHEQGELADQLEDLMTPTELWGYFREFTSQVEFQEEKPDIETKPALLLQGEEKKLV